MIIKKNTGSGAITILDKHIFADSTARDAYFVLHPTELVDGLMIQVGTDFEKYQASVTTFNTITAVVKGDAAKIQAGTVTMLPAGSSATVTNSGTTSNAVFNFELPNTDISSKQDTLISGTNIKTINGTSVLGSGNMVISGGGDGGAVDSVNGQIGTVVLTQDEIPNGTNYKQYSQAEKTKLLNITGTNTGDETTATIKTKLGAGSTSTDGYITSTDWNEFNGKQANLVSGTNIKTINGMSVLGSGDITVSGGIELGETSTTAYRGDRGKIAYDHSQLTDGTNPHTTTFANIASKPTTIAGYEITDAVDTFSAQLIGGNKTFNNSVKFSGAFNIGSAAGTIPDYRNVWNGAAQSMFKFTNNATGQLATDGLDVGIVTDGTAEIRQRENLPLNVYANNTLLATFNPDGTTSNLSGTWTTISDERLKTDISNISNPIEKVEAIARCVKHYSFINQDKYAKGARTGYIAQLLIENGFEGHVTQREPNDEEEGTLFGWTYKDEEYIEIENEEEVIKTRRVVDKKGDMVLGIENNFTPYLFSAFVVLLERVKKLEEKLS